MWLNFSRIGGEAMYVYWPVILIGVAVGTLFMPAPYFYQRSRGWFLYSNWRLLLAGVYPVEFRDFFLGDMYCSLTYAMGHLELFFCLYARHWNEPAMCNSSHSRLLGFFTTIPGIWRALQCLRRYHDTRDVFPHLVNCGKYGFTILSGMALSLFRIERTTEMMALYIVFASINSIYCSIWDVIMDWSKFIVVCVEPLHKLTSHRFGSSFGETQVPTPQVGLQADLVVLCGHGHRPNPPMQLDFLRHLWQRATNFIHGCIPHWPVRSHSSRYLDIVPCGKRALQQCRSLPCVARRSIAIRYRG